MSSIAYLPVLLAATAVAQPPQSMIDLCRGTQNIVSWAEIPHDWMDATRSGEWRGDGTEAKRYLGQDWWYWKADWKKKIANGDVDMEPSLGEEWQTFEDNKQLLGKCGNNAQKLRDIQNVATVSECRIACAAEFSTQTDTREKCQFFSYEAASEECILYSRCGWPFNTNDNDGGVDTQDTNCYGTETRADNCSWDDAAVWKTYRVLDIYPAGFQSFSLREFNQPPLCIHVPSSSDKKVEVMIETEMNDSRICIMDGRDMGVYTNDVGNVRTCDNGKLYSCFTAATRRAQGQNGDFYFYISCEGSCEASDVDVWVRIRKSERSWDEGKKDWASDIEYWCENERGTTAGEKKNQNKQIQEFKYPSELLPSEPRKYPYRINTEMGDSSAGAFSTVVAAVAGLVAAWMVL